MNTSHVISYEILEAQERRQVSVATHPGRVGWTTQARKMGPWTTGYVVEFPGGECTIAHFDYLTEVSDITIPLDLTPFAVPDDMPSNVIPFPQRGPAALRLIGGEA